MVNLYYSLVLQFSRFRYCVAFYDGQDVIRYYRQRVPIFRRRTRAIRPQLAALMNRARIVRRLSRRSRRRSTQVAQAIQPQLVAPMRRDSRRSDQAQPQSSAAANNIRVVPRRSERVQAIRSQSSAAANNVRAVPRRSERVRARQCVLNRPSGNDQLPQVSVALHNLTERNIWRMKADLGEFPDSCIDILCTSICEITNIPFHF